MAQGRCIGRGPGGEDRSPRIRAALGGCGRRSEAALHEHGRSILSGRQARATLAGRIQDQAGPRGDCCIASPGRPCRRRTTSWRSIARAPTPCSGDWTRSRASRSSARRAAVPCATRMTVMCSRSRRSCAPHGFPTGGVPEDSVVATGSWPRGTKPRCAATSGDGRGRPRPGRGRPDRSDGPVRIPRFPVHAEPRRGVGHDRPRRCARRARRLRHRRRRDPGGDARADRRTPEHPADRPRRRRAADHGLPRGRPPGDGRPARGRAAGPISRSLEIPQGPCTSFRTAGDLRIAVYQLVRPQVLEHFAGRRDF